MTQTIEQINDFMDDFEPNSVNPYFLYFLSTNSDPTSDFHDESIPFNTSHVWNQLTTYPSIFDWISLKTNSLPYYVNISEIYNKYRSKSQELQSSKSHSFFLMGPNFVSPRDLLRLNRDKNLLVRSNFLYTSVWVRTS